eukprot:7304074-Prymnesium_polylepis.1
MQGDDFVPEICELGVSKEDAERLEAALAAPAVTSARATHPPTTALAPASMPASSADRHAAVTAALEKATGVPQSSALAAALALV